MLKIAVINGSTRPGRLNEAVSGWVVEQSAGIEGAEFELVDIADFNLPLLDEPMPPMMHQYQHEHTKKWAETVAAYDGYVFVTPEYNHSTSGALKNAIDYLNVEWNDKAASFVGYGSAGGVRAVEHLRQIASEVRLAHVRDQVQLSLFTDFENFSDFKPTEGAHDALAVTLKDLVRWAGAMKTIR